MRSPRTTTLLAIAIPLFVLGAMSVASDECSNASILGALLVIGQRWTI